MIFAHFDEYSYVLYGHFRQKQMPQNIVFDCSGLFTNID